MTKRPNLEEIEARCEAAQYDVPKAFLARIARTDIPALVERVKELEEALCEIERAANPKHAYPEVGLAICRDTARRLLDGGK